MDELVKLREAVRAASGSDRAIDVRLLSVRDGKQFHWCENDKFCIGTPGHDLVVSMITDGVPKFTSSIDAALALCVRMGVPWIQTLRRATFISGSDVSRLARAIVEEMLTYLLEKEAANEAE